MVKRFIDFIPCERKPAGQVFDGCPFHPTSSPCRRCPHRASVLMGSPAPASQINSAAHYPDAPAADLATLMREFLDVHALVGERSAFHALIVTHKVPRLALYRYYDTRGRLIVYMNLTDFEYGRLRGTIRDAARDSRADSRIAAIYGVQVYFE